MLTGRYSVVHRASLAEKVRQFENDPAPGDLAGEVVLMRALLQDYLDRFPDGQAMRGDDIDRMVGLLESIGRMVERIHRIMAQTALTVAEVNYLQAALGDLLRRYLPEDDRRALLDELKSVTGGKVTPEDNTVRITVRYVNADGTERPRERTWQEKKLAEGKTWDPDFSQMTDEELQAIIDA